MKYIVERIFLTKGKERKSLTYDMEVYDLINFKRELKEIYKSDRVDLTYEIIE